MIEIFERDFDKEVLEFEPLAYGKNAMEAVAMAKEWRNVK